MKTRTNRIESNRIKVNRFESNRIESNRIESSEESIRRTHLGEVDHAVVVHVELLERVLEVSGEERRRAVHDAAELDELRPRHAPPSSSTAATRDNRDVNIDNNNRGAYSTERT